MSEQQTPAAAPTPEQPAPTEQPKATQESIGRPDARGISERAPEQPVRPIDRITKGLGELLANGNKQATLEDAGAARGAFYTPKNPPINKGGR